MASEAVTVAVVRFHFPSELVKRGRDRVTATQDGHGEHDFIAGTSMETETNKTNRPGRTLFHLLGFGLLLALILIVVRGAPQAGEAAYQVRFTEVDLKQISARHMRTWNRPPSREELRKAMELYMREEILYREALARDFDRNDPTVRLAMVRKVTMLGTARAEAREPSDKELEAYFSLRREQYRIPAVLDLLQVFVSIEKRGDKARSDAEKLLAELREQAPDADDLAAFGDSIMLPQVNSDISEDELARTFGNEFSKAVIALEPGKWTGPIESSYGLHLVKILKREDAAIPDWTEVRDKLIADMQFEARKAAEDQLYAEIAPRYQISYDDAVAGILEGTVQ